MQCNCCQCQSHKNKVRGVIGLLWNENLIAKELRDILNKEVDNELPLKYYELVINSMDLRTAQDYGQFDRAECTRTVATRSPYIVNLYYQYLEDRDKFNHQVVRYVQDHHGVLIIIKPENDESLTNLITEIKKDKLVDLYVVD